jgi:hypothetical protein
LGHRWPGVPGRQPDRLGKVDDESVAAIHAALDAGITFFDTANGSTSPAGKDASSTRSTRSATILTGEGRTLA